MKPIFSIAAFIFSVLGAQAALAQDRPVVVELFTSQGCSSCPPADAYLHELAKNPDIIALALHVDYWDYIGWKDSFASPAFTKRQRNYARVQSERVVYTPQMMINGVEHAVGNNKRDVSALLAKHANAKEVLTLSAEKNGQSITVLARDTRIKGDFDVFLVSYAPSRTVNIKRGENAGRRISYANVVTDWKSLGSWNGRGVFQARQTIRGEGQQVVLVQRQGQKEIVAAVRVR